MLIRVINVQCWVGVFFILSLFKSYFCNLVSFNVFVFICMKKFILFVVFSVVFVFFGFFSFVVFVVENWENYCIKCYGVDGKGQIKVGKKFDFKDYISVEVQVKMIDEEIIKVISDGVIDEKGKEWMKVYKDEFFVDEIIDFLVYVCKFKS